MEPTQLPPADVPWESVEGASAHCLPSFQAKEIWAVVLHGSVSKVSAVRKSGWDGCVHCQSADASS